MFTIEEILKAHSNVKSGADFPKYISELSKLGVTSYEVFVSNGQASYRGGDGNLAQSPAKYQTLEIAGTTNIQKFAANLKAHQQGQSDYLTFCRHAAEAGVYKWVVSVMNMTCTYYDSSGAAMLTEDIPG